MAVWYPVFYESCFPPVTMTPESSAGRLRSERWDCSRQSSQAQLLSYAQEKLARGLGAGALIVDDDVFHIQLSQE